MKDRHVQGAYVNEIFMMCLRDENWRNAHSLLDEMLGRPFWWGLHRRGNRCEISRIPSFKPWRKSRDHRHEKCRKAVIRGCGTAYKERKVSNLECNSGCHGFVYPFVRGSTFYGAVAVCHLKHDPSHYSRELALLGSLAKSVLETSQKNYELSKLYDTIRPRAIALSTVHTVHRILSSTLNEEELMMKIVRLTMQLMKARCSSVMFVDDAGRSVVTSACVGMKQKNIRMGEGVQGRVARTGNPYRNSNMVCVPIIDENVIGIITVKGRLDGKDYSLADEELLSTLAEQVSIAVKNARLYDEQQKVIMGSVKSIAKLLDAASHPCYKSSGGFVDLVLAIARAMHLPQDEVTSLHYAALLHGAGGIRLMNGIAGKKGRLSNREKRIIRSGPGGAASIIRPIEVLKPVIPVIVHHHEQYDGRGYPDGLKGEEIPVGSCIMAVADAFMAMISKRPHARARSIPDAVEELCRNKGVQFSPKVVDAFVKLAKEGAVEKIVSSRAGIRGRPQPRM